MKEDELTRLFSPYGNMQSITVKRDHETHESKGFAFATFTNLNDAEMIRQRFNHTIYNGRELKVCFKKNPTE